MNKFKNTKHNDDYFKLQVALNNVVKNIQYDGESDHYKTPFSLSFSHQ